MIDREFSRRQLLVRSAAAAAGLSLSMSMMAAKRARAMVDPTPDPAKDNTQLTALWMAELDAVATYTAGAGIINADSSTPMDVKNTVLAVATHFKSQHQDHADALAKMITDNGGTATPPATVTPSLPSTFKAKTNPTTTDVIKLAADKEKKAAYTYAQVMQAISTQAAAKLVASIGAVETQHFVVLYLLAESMIEPTAATNTMAQLVVPASFVLNVGLSGTTNLESFPALDAALALDPPKT